MTGSIDRSRQAVTQRGVTLLEALLGGALTMALLVFAAQAMMSGMDSTRDQAAADHLRQVQSAVERYMRGQSDPADPDSETNHAVLSDALALGQAQQIDIRDLMPLYLPGNFGGCDPADATCQPLNPFGEPYEIRVRKAAEDPDVLEVAVATVAPSLRPEMLRRAPAIAARAGAGAGFIDNSGALTGSFGGWSENLGNFGFANLQSGSLASLQGFESGQLIGDYIHRRRVPGQPEANTMDADLNMNAYSIGNIGLLDARDIVVRGDVGSERAAAADDTPVGVTTMRLDVNTLVADQIVLPSSGAVFLDSNQNGVLDGGELQIDRNSLAVLEELFAVGACPEGHYITRSGGNFRCQRGSMPAGMVMAFIPDPNRNEDAQTFGCPPGWVDFDDADGRFIVGAGDPVDDPATAAARLAWEQDTSPFRGPPPPDPVGHSFGFRESGGQAEVVITPSNLPAGVWFDRGSGRSFVRSGGGMSLTPTAGGDLTPDPVDMTPPWYGVRYCQKV